MDQILERCSLPRLNQQEGENMNRLITSTEIESVILKPPKNKNPGLVASQADSIKHLEKS